MNIDTFLFPKFKRFDSMNLGLKRLLFLLSFPLATFLIAGSIFAIIYNAIVVPNMKQEPIVLFAPAFVALSYFLFWVIVRLFLWIYDGFVNNSNNR